MSGGSMRSACAGDMTCNERNIAGGMEADALKHRRMISKNRNAYVKSERVAQSLQDGTAKTRALGFVKRIRVWFVRKLPREGSIKLLLNHALFPFARRQPSEAYRQVRNNVGLATRYRQCQDGRSVAAGVFKKKAIAGWTKRRAQSNNNDDMTRLAWAIHAGRARKYAATYAAPELCL